MTDMLAVSVLTKTNFTMGLVLLALFEFWTAMHVFGRRGPKKAPQLVLRLHRIGGYVFLIYWLWPIFVGLDLLGRLSEAGTGWTMTTRVFFHAFLGVTVLLLLLLKIAFIRVYTSYRQQARLLGFLIVLGSILTWLIAGWFWLNMMGSPVIER